MNLLKTSPCQDLDVILLQSEWGGKESTFAMGAMGDDGSSDLTSVEEFNPETLSWKPAAGNLLVTRAWFGAIALPRHLV